VNFAPATGNEVDTVVDTWVQRLIQRPISDAKRKVLIDALAGKPTQQENVKRMIQLIVSMPEYQLC